MEPKFQNAFIPKKPIVTEKTAPRPRKQRSFFGVVVTLIFVAALLSAVAVYGYKFYIKSDISNKDVKLQEEIESLEPDLIRELALADARLKVAGEALSNHLVPSRFFEHLEDITLQSIRFTEFSYVARPGESPTIVMSGISDDYSSVALQSDVFAEDENFINPVFSGLNLSEEGFVVFEVEVKISSKLTSYK
ncbi:MAG: hypothetical protein MRY49_00440 [Candidatus Pacebacteria bacterium]|nr:hypothetical protein [Candidatus Paceibacterota bacterium]